MGCDIHAFIEVKIDNEWHNYMPLNIVRDYQLFSRMTNIVGRGNQIAIINEKGLPVDLSKILKIIMNNCDYHTFSYLNYEEIILLHDWIKEKNLFKNHDWIYEFEDLNDYYYDEFDDYRLVFAFDN